MTENPDPKDMLHIIQRQAELLGRLEGVLQRNARLLKGLTEAGTPYPDFQESVAAHEETINAIWDIANWRQENTPDAD